MKILIASKLKIGLIGVLLLFSLLMFTSCNSKNEVQIPEKAIQDNPPANAIELSATERTVKNNVYLNGENVGNLRESEVLTKIRNYAGGIDKEASDATLDGATWQVTKGKVGKKINIENTLDALLNAQENKKVDLIVNEVLPTVTSQKLLGNIVVIGNYTTPLLDRDASRVNNIELATQKINCFKLSPGEEFSFNRVVGNRTEAKGYEDAPIIINTKDGPKKDEGIGGGICQVSTTLYNAVEECQLEMLERHLHSKNVGYVPKGEDATVNYGSADFRFRNTRNHPIMIRVYLEKKTLTIKIIENRNL